MQGRLNTGSTREAIEKKKGKGKGKRIIVSSGFQHPKKKQRVRVIEYWIETARECFNIGNFNSLMAIIAGLNISPISRLKKTVSCVLFKYILNIKQQL